jgi:hypothetical protein
MLNFIPMNNKANIYSASGKDSWGKPTLTLVKSGVKCQINYNTDLTTISGEDGFATSMSATLVFGGFVQIANGDYVEFTTAGGITNKYRVSDLFYFEDYGGKIVATRVVVGNGKRS